MRLAREGSLGLEGSRNLAGTEDETEAKYDNLDLESSCFVLDQ